VDLFCGAGGLTHGLMKAGIRVVAGIDIDVKAKYAFETNNTGTKFLSWDLSRRNSRSLESLYPEGGIRVLAGCAPCKPFSKLTNGISDHKDWDLLDYFGRFVNGLRPDIVTMENVPELAERGVEVFDRFKEILRKNGYHIDHKIVNCADYGVPQMRRRLVLLASRLGAISVPPGRYRGPRRWKTVRQTVGELRPLSSGQVDATDRLHVSPLLSETNLKRIKATPHDGGTQEDWPKHLVLKCHRKKSGKTYKSIYGRMWWDKPAPTMTTLCTGIGNGRFGHPKQNRSITLREAAMFQSFPKTYAFWPDDQKLNKDAVGRFIGNAVPPKLARSLGKTIVEHVKRYG